MVQYQPMETELEDNVSVPGQWKKSWTIMGKYQPIETLLKIAVQYSPTTEMFGIKLPTPTIISISVNGNKTSCIKWDLDILHRGAKLGKHNHLLWAYLCGGVARHLESWCHQRQFCLKDELNIMACAWE